MSNAVRGVVQGRLGVDETRERSTAEEGEGLDLIQVAPNMEASGQHFEATTEEERVVDWTQDLREIRRMVEFMVRRERKLDVKADVAVRRLEAGERTIPAGRGRKRNQPPRRPRGQDQSREARRQVPKRKSSSSTPALSEVPKSLPSALTRGCRQCTTTLETRGRRRETRRGRAEQQSRRRRSPRCAAILEACTVSQPKKAMSRRWPRAARFLWP